MNAEPSRREAIPVHLLPDSERLLKTHNAWIASWDNSDEQPDPNFDALLKEAFNYYAMGLSPIQVKWRLQDEHSSLPARTIARIQRHAEKALCAAESAPAEIRRALVAAQRQTAIQGALAAGEWGAALRGLDRAGEIAGELRESAGLSDDDLVLTVTVEGDAALLSQPVSGEIEGSLTVETAETEDES